MELSFWGTYNLAGLGQIVIPQHPPCHFQTPDFQLLDLPNLRIQASKELVMNSPILWTNQVWQLQPHGMKWGCYATNLCHGTQYESKQEWESEFCWREERGWMEVHIGASLSPFRNQISMMLWPQDMNHETACHENQCSGTRSSYFLFAGVLMMCLGFPHSHKWSLNIPGRCLLHIFILSFLHLQCSWSSGWDNNLNFLQKATTRQAKATCTLSWWCLP